MNIRRHLMRYPGGNYEAVFAKEMCGGKKELSVTWIEIPDLQPSGDRGLSHPADPVDGFVCGDHQCAAVFAGEQGQG